MPESNTTNHLNNAITLADKFRYISDKKNSSSITKDFSLNSTRIFFSHNYLKITKQVTPSLSKCLDNVFNNLNINPEHIDAYIYPSPDIQAECLSSSHNDCIIRFSSGLIELLDDKEIEFVAGHEIGHFLLSHRGCQNTEHNESVEYYINRRAQELSADRIGYISCNSLEVSLRALMKTISGLSSKYLRYDISNFIAQIKTAENIYGLTGIEVNATTHPSIILRCRALLWFSLVYDEKHENIETNDLEKIDLMIKNDMDKYVDKAARVLIDEAKEQVKFWGYVYRVICKDAFSKSDQELIRIEFGNEKLESLKNFLHNQPKSTIKKDILERLEESKRELYNIAPLNYDDVIRQMDNFISTSMG